MRQASTVTSQAIRDSGTTALFWPRWLSPRRDLALDAAERSSPAACAMPWSSTRTGRLLAGSEDLAEPASALMRATDSAAVEVADAARRRLRRAWRRAGHRRGGRSAVAALPDALRPARDPRRAARAPRGMRQRRLTQDVAGSLRRRRERLVLRVRLYDESGRVRRWTPRATRPVRSWRRPTPCWRPARRVASAAPRSPCRRPPGPENPQSADFCVRDIALPCDFCTPRGIPFVCAAW